MMGKYEHIQYWEKHVFYLKVDKVDLGESIRNVIYWGISIKI